MTDGLNKYLHGTVWEYPQNKRGEKKLALIISDTKANLDSPTVSVALVASGAANEYFSVAMDANYQIQCDQIHTVAKEDLKDYVGALPAKALASVKAKICAYLTLDAESRAELAKAVVGMTEALSQMIASEAGLPAPAPRAVPQTPAVKKADAPKPDASQPKAEKPDKPAKPAKRGRKKKADASAKISKKTGKPVRKFRKYTDDEKAFIADSSATEIMTRFDLKDKKAAFALRNYVRSKQPKPENPEA